MARYNYWTSSEFIVWLRNKYGLKKPIVASSAGWKKWRAEYLQKSPLLYKITEKWPNKLQNFFYWPSDKLNALYFFINARFKDHYYALPSTLAKGAYHEIDTRMLYCNFQTLVDFVEIENAVSVTFSSNEQTQKELNAKYGIKWYHRNRWISLFAPTWRSAEAGRVILDLECEYRIDEQYLGYHPGEMTDEQKAETEHFGELTGQAIAARKIRDLYIWWTSTRPARPDPMDASGYTKLFDEKMNKSKNDIAAYLESTYTPEDKIASNMMWKIEEQNEKEDEEKLIELITIRRTLWT